MQSILYPSHCFSCGRLGPAFCLRCRRGLIPIQADTCLYCEKTSKMGLTHLQCNQNKGVDGNMSILHYKGPLKKIFTSIKFGLATEGWKDLFLSIRPEFCYKLIPWLQFVGKDAILSPIPLHPQRKKERGFNQAETICRFFQILTQLPRRDVLIRTINTPKQSLTINKQERQNNIQGSYQWIQGGGPVSNLIFIDDIITTGSTIHEAAIEAKKHSVKRVFALSLARG